MSYATVINRSGQATIPKAIREILRVDVGEKIEFEVEQDRVLLRRKMTDEEFLAKIDALKSDRTKELMKKYKGRSVAELKRMPEVVDKYKGKYINE